MVDADRDRFVRSDQGRGVAHVLEQRIHAADEAGAGEQREPALPRGVREVAVITQIANPPQHGILTVAIDDRGGVRAREVAARDMRMRHAEAVVEGLDPTRLRNRVRLVRGRVDMDHGLHLAEARLRQEVLGPIALRLQSTHGTDRIESAHLGLQPGVMQARLLQIKEVHVRIDESPLRHCVSSRRPWAGTTGSRRSCRRRRRVRTRS